MRSAPYEELATAFRHGNVGPLYMLYGEERYFVDRLQRLFIDNALQPHERDFNLDIVYGADTDIQSVLALCASYPVMAPRRVVVVRDFDKLEDNRRFKAYAEQPNPAVSVLLIASARVKHLPYHPYRAIKQHGVAAEFKRLYEREVPRWLEGAVREQGLEIEPRAVGMLAEYVGNNLAQAVTEIDKLVTFAADRGTITADDVVQASGQTREFNVFELQKAIGEIRHEDALRIAERMLQQASNVRGEALMIVSVLVSFFSKLWVLTTCQTRRIPEKEMAGKVGIPPYFLREYLNTMQRFDPPALAYAFRTLAAADYELKGGSARDERTVLALTLQRLVVGSRNAVGAA